MRKRKATPSFVKKIYFLERRKTRIGKEQDFENKRIKKIKKATPRVFFIISGTKIAYRKRAGF